MPPTPGAPERGRLGGRWLVPLRLNRVVTVLVFYLLAFAMSWLIQVPLVAAARGLLQVDLPDSLAFISALAPLASALLVTARIGGATGVRRLLGRLLRWRVALRWYVVALFGLPALAVIAIGLASLLTGQLPDLSNSYVDRVLPKLPGPLGPWLLLPAFLLYSIVTTIPEEVGWRGFALPRAQQQYGPLRASLLVGVLWGLWHLPLFFSPDTAQSGISFPLFLALTVSSSFLFTWVFDRSGGSLLMVVLLHSSFNASTVFLPLLPQVTGSDLQLLLFVGVIAVAAAAVAVDLGQKRVWVGRL